MAARKRPSSPDRGKSARGRQAYDGLVRSQLGDLQRARILSAVYEVSRERGAGNVSVAHFVDAAGVSRRTFYEQFSDREDCLLAAFTQSVAAVRRRVEPAFEAHSEWREQVRAGLGAFLSFLDEEPSVGRMLVVESLSAGKPTLARRAELIDSLTRIVDRGRALSKSEALSPLTAEGVVGGALAVIQSRLLEGPREPLAELTGPLMSMIVLPYLGAAAARRELARAPSPPLNGNASVESGSSVVLPTDPFKALGMRLTYRTVRVLLATAEHPGGSNRLIGETAGIGDQGQISKLLGRLQRLGLVSNTGAGAGKGAPNAWTLTEQGTRIAEAMRVHTQDLQ